MSEQQQVHLAGSLKRLLTSLLVFLIVGCNPTIESGSDVVLTLPENYYDNPYDHPNSFLEDIKFSKKVTPSTLAGIFDLILEVERLSLEKYGQTSPVSLGYDPIKEVLKLDPSLKNKTIDRSNQILIEHVTDSIEKLKTRN